MSEEEKITPEFLKTLTQAITSASLASNHSLIHQIAIQPYGGDREGIFSFIEKFEENTAQLDDKQKLTVLQKFLNGSAKTWFKLSIQPKIDDKSWKEVKTALIDRFGGSDQTNYHLDKIRGMKFDPSSRSVANHVEQFVYHFRKAYPDSQSDHLVREVHRSLPRELQADINKFTSTQAITKIEDYIKKIQSYDDQVFSLVPRTASINSIQNNDEIASVLIDKLKPFIEGLIKDNTQQPPIEEEPIAALHHQQRNQYYNPNYQHPQPQFGQRQQPTVRPYFQQCVQNNYPNNRRMPTYHRTYQHYTPGPAFNPNPQYGSQPVQNINQQQVQYRGPVNQEEQLPYQNSDEQNVRNDPRQQIVNSGQPNNSQTGFSGCFKCGGGHYARNCHLNFQGRPQ